MTFSENPGYKVNIKINLFSGVSENAMVTTSKIFSIKATRTKKLAKIVSESTFSDSGN